MSRNLVERWAVGPDHRNHLKSGKHPSKLRLGGNFGCGSQSVSSSRSFRAGALHNCRHLRRGARRQLSDLYPSHFSSTAITDTQSQSRNNSPTVQYRKLCPSPETDPTSAAKPSSALFEKLTQSRRKSS